MEFENCGGQQPPGLADLRAAHHPRPSCRDRGCWPVLRAAERGRDLDMQVVTLSGEFDRARVSLAASSEALERLRPEHQEALAWTKNCEPRWPSPIQLGDHPKTDKEWLLPPAWSCRGRLRQRRGPAGPHLARSRPRWRRAPRAASAPRADHRREHQPGTLHLGAQDDHRRRAGAAAELLSTW